jgi:hypothetical protein
MIAVKKTFHSFLILEKIFGEEFSAMMILEI